MVLLQESSNNLISIFFKQQLLIRVVSHCQRQNPSNSMLFLTCEEEEAEESTQCFSPADWCASPQSLLSNRVHQVGLAEAIGCQETENLSQPQQEIMYEQAHQCCGARALLWFGRAALPQWYSYTGRGASPSGWKEYHLCFLLLRRDWIKIISTGQW